MAIPAEMLAQQRFGCRQGCRKTIVAALVLQHFCFKKSMKKDIVHFSEFVKTNYREPKPRSTGITEVRGPYYSVAGPNYLQDLFQMIDAYIDSIKFAGGSFAVIQSKALERIIKLAHDHSVLVSTGGFIEYVLTQGKKAIKEYLDVCSQLGFDIVELSAGFITLPTDDWLRLIELVQKAGMKAKPEIGIQFGAGGNTPASELKRSGQRDTGYAIKQAKKFLDAGAYMIMIESEGITENTEPWRTDAVAAFIDELGMEKLMFEAADPPVFEWYLKNYGHKINLFVDHSQIIQLECLRQGIWGTQSSWGRIQGLE
jgi:phosphosulfolactate synthase (CoM biosynthesis protein A)